VAHPAQRLADKIVDVKMSRFGPQVIIDYNKVLPDENHKPHKPLNKDIKDEINNQHEFTNRYLCRYDTHPTPAEYLEYITRVAPDIEVSTATQDWVTTVTDRLIKHQDLTKLWKPNKKPARF
jgi:hypothetical protein